MTPSWDGNERRKENINLDKRVTILELRDEYTLKEVKATRDDIKNLEVTINKALIPLMKDNQDNKNDIADVKNDIAVVKNDLSWMKWLATGISSAVGALVGFISGRHS